MPLHALTRITAFFVTVLIARPVSSGLGSSGASHSCNIGSRFIIRDTGFFGVAKDASSLVPPLAVLSGGAGVDFIERLRQ